MVSLPCPANASSYSHQASSGPGKTSAVTRRNCDVIIVGAGVAGSALAHTLAKEGRRVHVIERDLREPDRFSGELLQPAGYLKLVELGLQECVEGIDAQKLFGYAVSMNGKSIRIPYPLENYDSHVAGRSFRNGRFVTNLRLKAQSLLNVQMERGTVTSLIEERGVIKGVKYTRNGESLTMHAPLTVVSDGCSSRFRKLLFQPRVKVDRACNFVGVVLKNCSNPHPNYAHLVLGSQTNFVLYPINHTDIRFIIDFPGTKLPSISNGEMNRLLHTAVVPQLPPELRSPFVTAIQKHEIKIMPGHIMAAAPRILPGAFLLGDALNMRHALAGGGMAVALQDIAVLKDLLRAVDLYDSAEVTKRIAQFYDIRKPAAFTMNTLANAAAKISYAMPDAIRRDVQEAFFEYLNVGSVLSKGIVGMMSGLKNEPHELLLQSMAASAYIAGSILAPIPSPQKLQKLVQFATIAADASMPVILEEFLGQHPFSPTRN